MEFLSERALYRMSVDELIKYMTRLQITPDELQRRLIETILSVHESLGVTPLEDPCADCKSREGTKRYYESSNLAPYGYEEWTVLLCDGCFDVRCRPLGND